MVDDEPSMLQYLKTVLEAEAYQVETARTGSEALERIRQDPAPEVVLLDVLMPDIDGLQTLERLQQARSSLKVVMLSCSTDPRKVVQAIRLGAVDYLTKPFQIDDLEAVIKHSLSMERAPGQIAEAEHTIEELGDDLCFIAASPAMRKIRAQVEQMASVNVPVLLLGESGTGKEVAARLIHSRSARASRMFLKVNCAALPGELLESELFGFEAGAFTGATRPKPGKFELCHKGTILLDEIGELPSSLQAKLLHVLQDQEISRLGSRTTIKIDVRILAATNINIAGAIASKTLREDLYYRLNAFTLNMPPLRERREEIPLLLRQFMARYAGRYARTPLPLSPGLVDACSRYSWPGNLRELENFVKRYLILGDESLARHELQVKAEDQVPTRDTSERAAGAAPDGAKSLLRSVKDEAEIEAISRALGETNWNRKEAARRLNISYKALLYKIRQYRLEQRTH